VLRVGECATGEGGSRVATLGGETGAESRTRGTEGGVGGDMARPRRAATLANALRIGGPNSRGT
jgi:hypothetical protein